MVINDSDLKKKKYFEKLENIHLENQIYSTPHTSALFVLWILSLIYNLSETFKTAFCVLTQYSILYD